MAESKPETKTPEPPVEPEVKEEEVAAPEDSEEFIPPHLWDEQERILKERYRIQGYEYEPRPYPFEAPAVEEVAE